MGRGGRLARAAAITAAVLGLPFLIVWHEHVWWWVEVHTGTVNESGPWYGFFSGFGSDLQEFAIFLAVGGLYHRHNCHEKGCPRIGRHVVDGTPWCNKHHVQAREREATCGGLPPGS